jgi:hypothetical protein
MRLVSHFPRDAEGKPALTIDFSKPDAHELYRVILLVDAYMLEDKRKGREVEGITGYTNFDQLDKLLTLAYWLKYDGLTKGTLTTWASFQEWYLTKATWPDHIGRARRWLREQHLAEFPKGVTDRAARQQKRYADKFSGKGWE